MFTVVRDILQQLRFITVGVEQLEIVLPYYIIIYTGQFWNVEISVEDYVGAFRNGEVHNLVLVTLTPSDRDARTFPAWREQKV